jgi:Cadherin domain
MLINILRLSRYLFCLEIICVIARVLRVKALSHLGFPVTYELTTDTGVQSNEFAIDQRTGVIDLLHTLDYESDPIEYHLKVRAIENRRVPATSTVNVSLDLYFIKLRFVTAKVLCNEGAIKCISNENYDQLAGIKPDFA